MPHSLSRALGAALLLLAAGAAHAQYVWIGPNGTRQYSDRPPPAGTPASKIIKSPGRAQPAPVAEPTVEAPAREPEAKGPPTLADRETAYRERTKKAEEDERKRQDEAKRERQLAERCSEARQAQAQIDSGIRIARIGQDGQKTYMTDDERAARSAQVSRALQGCRQAQ